jgi:hypothetical protein
MVRPAIGWLLVAHRQCVIRSAHRALGSGAWLALRQPDASVQALHHERRQASKALIE